jgi:hypothetical protein
MISARAQRAPHVSLPPREEEGASAETFRVSAAASLRLRARGPVESARATCPFVTGLSGWKSLVKPLKRA